MPHGRSDPLCSSALGKLPLRMVEDLESVYKSLEKQRTGAGGWEEENLRREAINEEQKQEVDRLHIARSCW